MTTREIFKLCDVVRETGFVIHRYHRNGHVEKIYQNALLHRLRKQTLEVEAEFPLTVYDEDGTVLGYMRAGRIEHGLLINFGGRKFEIRKYVLQDAIQKL